VLHNYVVYYILHPEQDEHSSNSFHGDTEVLEKLTFVDGLFIFTSFLCGEQFGWESW